MKKIILLTGDLAAGKSTFSRLLADRYKIPCYNKDDIKVNYNGKTSITFLDNNKQIGKVTITYKDNHIYEEDILLKDVKINFYLLVIINLLIVLFIFKIVKVIFFRKK